MDDTKECDIFKELYSTYLKNGLEKDSEDWMKNHLKFCLKCNKWKIRYDNKPYMFQNKKSVEFSYIILLIGTVILMFIIIWVYLNIVL